MLKASIEDVEASATLGCDSCAVLRDGIALFEPEFRAATPPASGALPQSISGYFSLQREGYSLGHTKTAFGDNEKVINSAYGRGCGGYVSPMYTGMGRGTYLGQPSIWTFSSRMVSKAS